MIEPLLQTQLEPIAKRYRRLRLLKSLAVCWAAGIGLLLLVNFAPPSAEKAAVTGVLCLVGVAAAVASLRAKQWNPDYRRMAHDIEAAHPDLHALLLTAVEQKPDASGRMSYLQEKVVRDAIYASVQQDWKDALSPKRFFWAQTAQWTALILFVCMLILPRSGGSKATLVERRAMGNSVSVTPGDITLERGSPLVVLARFSGKLPAEAILSAQPSSGEPFKISLNKNLNDPVFGGSVPEVQTDLIYAIDYDGQRTAEYRVKVFDFPRLERVDAQVTYPSYTGLPPKEIKETHRISAVEGSQLQLRLALNKPVATARLKAKDKSVVPLQVETNKPMATLPAMTISNSKTFEIELVAHDGRTNKVPAQLVVEALKNRTPELKLSAPRGDQRLSPLQEIGFQGEAWDDFGLREYGMTYTIAGKPPTVLSLGTNAGPNEKRQFGQQLLLEKLGVAADELVSWFVWADDVGPDGELRRTSSDMFFAEIRPFDEIFREGGGMESDSSSESQQGQGQGNQTLKLAELQKQIINATWKLERQQGKSKASEQFKKDLTVVKESQEQALEQAQARKEQARDPRAEAQWEAVEKQMTDAIDALEGAAESATLPTAVAAEQGAYQALLKLSSREFQVSQNRSQSRSQGQGQQSNQQQVNQLDLKQKENRYEKQRQAAPLQNPEQREQMQVMNRLKELAQRQQDLNEQVKELQAALREAKTEEEKEELRRRLKRLREEQQEILADVDELKQRMDKPENQSRMAEARQQLEQTRSEIQQASEALDKGDTSQALSAGTRAQEELQELRDDMRKQNANQFAEDMRDLRGEARELAEKQSEIQKQMEEMTDTKQKRLSGSEKTKEIAEQLQQQQNSLTNLLDHMRAISEQSETAEPLLSKQLYDTVRKTSQGQLEKSLEMAEELLKRSFPGEAAQFEQRAREEITQLKEGVERAAQSVLGDDTEALRAAKRQVEELAAALQKEMANANGARGTNGNAGPGGTNSLAGTAGRTNAPSGSPGGTNGLAGVGRGTNNVGNTNSFAGGPGGTNRLAQNSGLGTNSLAQAGGSRPGTNSQNNGNSGQQSAGQSPENQQASAGQQPGQGQQPGGQSQQPGQQGNQPGQGSPREGQSNSEQAQASQQSQNGSQPGQNGQASTGQPQGTQGQGQNPQTAQQNGGNQAGGGANRASQEPRSERQQRAEAILNRMFAGEENGGDGGGGGGGPLTGQNYVEWADRLRDVEEMVDLPDLRMDIARIRDRARAFRNDYKKNSKPPEWELVQRQVAGPLLEVRRRLAEELAKRESSDALVPIDRDPVPPVYSELVRKYYEKLGASEPGK